MFEKILQNLLLPSVFCSSVLTFCVRVLKGAESLGARIGAFLEFLKPVRFLLRFVQRGENSLTISPRVGILTLF